MPFAETFRSLDFLDQAQALQELRQRPAAEAVAELRPLFAQPGSDAAAATMVRNALRDTLRTAPELATDGLADTDAAYAALCREVVASERLVSAVPKLIVLGQTTADTGLLHEILTTLASIGSQDALPLLRMHMQHADPVIAALCIQSIGHLRDTHSIASLSDIISAANTEARLAQCDITTWKAIEALGVMADTVPEEALSRLAAFIHHGNPTARRIILANLVNCGEAAISHLAPMLLDAETDNRIMAANAFRDIAHKSAAAPLIYALEHGAAVDANVGFAIYEALGNTPGVKSLVALTDALTKEDDPVTLMAIIQALESLATPVLGKRLSELVTDRLNAQDTRAQRILSTIIAAQATTLFQLLHEDPVIGRILVSLAAKSADPETQRAFVLSLRQCSNDRAEKDMRTLLAAMPDTQQSKPRMLAVDDSTAMRNFYRTHGSAIGLEVTLAEHGQEALDIVETLSGVFDVIVVDMNMPVMDGIQFTEKLRAMSEYATVPVIMATTESGRSQASLARQSGVSAFLAKPFTPEMLQHKLQKLMERNKN